LFDPGASEIMFETKSGVLLIAGIGFFALAFVSNGLVPILMYRHLPEKTVEDTLNDQLEHAGWATLSKFKDLADEYPEQFKKYYGDEPTLEKCAEALRLGRKVYIGEGCWHCHSQFIRPVSNEDKRWGPVSTSEEYQNELQRPVMFGTRRVGPDLIREAGRRGNDWHAVHFFKPKMASPESVMPEYPWFFDGDPGKPNKRGLALITYMQWLGSAVKNQEKVNTTMSQSEM
jgi:cytochrome c oxidase cbb3-type subunit 2